MNDTEKIFNELPSFVDIWIYRWHFEMINVPNSDSIRVWKILYRPLYMAWKWLELFVDKKIEAEWLTLFEAAEKIKLVLIKNKLWNL